MLSLHQASMESLLDFYDVLSFERFYLDIFGILSRSYALALARDSELALLLISRMWSLGSQLLCKLFSTRCHIILFDSTMCYVGDIVNAR